jgi:hypothetical protein
MATLEMLTKRNAALINLGIDPKLCPDGVYLYDPSKPSGSRTYSVSARMTTGVPLRASRRLTMGRVLTVAMSAMNLAKMVERIRPTISAPRDAKLPPILVMTVDEGWVVTTSVRDYVRKFDKAAELIITLGDGWIDVVGKAHATGTVTRENDEDADKQAAIDALKSWLKAVPVNSAPRKPRAPKAAPKAAA